MVHVLPTVDKDFDALPYGFAETESNDAAYVRERALWCAVLQQAFVDAGIVTVANSRPKRAPCKPEFHAAMRFLQQDRVDFPLVCELAGVSPAVIREGASRIER